LLWGNWCNGFWSVLT